MWGLEGSLRPNTMQFAQGSDWSNRAHIVLVRAESPDYTTLLFTALRIEKPGKEEGKQAFLNATPKTNRAFGKRTICSERGLSCEKGTGARTGRAGFGSTVCGKTSQRPVRGKLPSNPLPSCRKLTRTIPFQRV
ncbi:unnamed protein product [Leuciscus chuanchicus]